MTLDSMLKKSKNRKSFHYILCFFISLGIHSNLKALECSVEYACFQDEEGPYIEVYTQVLVNSVSKEFTPDSMILSSVEVLFLFKQDSTIVRFDKFSLNAPQSRMASDFINVKRYRLDKGTYQFDYEIMDTRDSANVVKKITPVDIVFHEKVALSDINLLSSYKADNANTLMHKNGYYLESLPYAYYGKKYEHLISYFEIYHSDEIADDFFISMTISSLTNPDFEINKYKRLTPKETQILIIPMDISKVPSGKFRFTIQLKNKDKALLDEVSKEFLRTNPEYDFTLAMEDKEAVSLNFVEKLADEKLDYYLKSLMPRVNPTQRDVINYLVKKSSPEKKRLYISNYWNENFPQHAEVSFDQYNNVLTAVDNSFNNGFGHGFETDRGYIFLKYGKPDDKITVEDEPSAPPYEIWMYYKLNGTTEVDVKFLFYNPSLVTNGYILLHSTARTERNNPRWLAELYSDAPNELNGSSSLEANDIGPGFNRRAKELMEDN